MPIDYDNARALLESNFSNVENGLMQGSLPEIDEAIARACDTLFSSRTQAYREVLLGCTVARIQDRSVNIRQPYADQGAHAFSGRSLDERVINPFLKSKQIPSSGGPYLAVFRRSVRFDVDTARGLKDQRGYEAFLSLIDYLERTSEESGLGNFLRYLLYRFIKLREAAIVPIFRVQRMSLEQYDSLLTGLLAVQSGGLLPVLLVVATFNTIKEFLNLDWEIAWQRINVADAASGAGGDITIRSAGNILLAAEVTERPVDQTRIITTFTTKIAPSGIEDYLFFLKLTPSNEVRQQARSYFAQGHEINFLEIKGWILMLLATVGRKGRSAFNRILTGLLDSPDIPRTVKVAWNEHLGRIASS